MSFPVLAKNSQQASSSVAVLSKRKQSRDQVSSHVQSQRDISAHKYRFKKIDETSESRSDLDQQSENIHIITQPAGQKLEKYKSKFIK